MKLANLYSSILSPTLVALYVSVLFIFFSPVGNGQMGVLYSIAVAATFLTGIPMLILFYFKLKGEVDLDVQERSRRDYFYIAAILSFVIATLIFRFMENQVMFLISLTYVSVTTAMFLINMKWKISAHSCGVAGPTTALIYIFGAALVPLYLLTFGIIYARLRQKAHSINELLGGAVVSIVLTSAIYTALWLL